MKKLFSNTSIIYINFSWTNMLSSYTRRFGGGRRGSISTQWIFSVGSITWRRERPSKNYLPGKGGD